jgi:hypothetical protein
MRISALRLAAAAMFLLAGCGVQELPAPPTTPAATTRAADVATVDQASTERYRYDVQYPTLAPRDATLAAAMRAYGEQRKREFLAAAAGAPRPPDTEFTPWTLTLRFDVRADTGQFLSVVATGDAYSGGAHGNPLIASFVLHRASDRVVTMADLFTDAEDGERALGEYARRELVQRRGANRSLDDAEQRWLRDGTAPRPENYAVFAIDGEGARPARGLVLIFPPYQVAPYAEGTIEVTVPAAVFRERLRPMYRGAFDNTGQ